MVTSAYRWAVQFAAIALVAGAVVGVDPSPVSADPADSGDPVVVAVSSTTSGSVGGVSFEDADVVAWDSVDGSWSMVFDGSANGLAGGADVNGVHLADPLVPIVWLSFQAPTAVPGLGIVDDSDVVAWNGATSSYAMLLDGSAVGLTTSSEDIDAIASTSQGLAISTVGGANVPGLGGSSLAARDEDLLLFDDASGEFSLFIDGSDIGLGGEDTVGASFSGTTSQVFFTNLGSFNIDGLIADRDDVAVFTGAVGDTTVGTLTAFFDGDEHDLSGEQLDGLTVILEPPPNAGSADLSITKVDDVDPVMPGEEVTYTITVSNAGPDVAQNVVVTDIVPAGMSLDATDGCAQDPSGVPCSLGNIAVNGSRTVSLVATVDQTSQAGVLVNSASVTAGTSDPNPADNTASESTTVALGPAAVDDGPASNSLPGDAFHGPVDTILDSPNLLDNDTPGDPVAVVATFGGGDAGGDASSNNAGIAIALAGGGSLQVDPDGSYSFDPPSGFEGLFQFDYRISNLAAGSDATVSLLIGDRPTAHGAVIYLSSTTSGTVDGISFADEDITGYDPDTDTWAMVFDGSDVGLAATDLNAVFVQNPADPLTPLLLSVQAPVNVPGLGSVDDSDIITFTPTSLGDTTAGTFTMTLDGTLVGLTTSSEDIDAISTGPSGELLISTTGGANVAKTGGGTLRTRDEDFLVYSQSDQTFALFYDGSDVDLATEDLTAGHYDSDTGTIYGAAISGFAVNGLAGDRNDIFAFTPTATGPTTAGSYSLLFDGNDLNASNEQLDAIHIATATTPDIPPTAVDDDETIVQNAPAATIDVLGNDTNPDGGPIAIASVTQPPNGAAIITNDGADLTYQPDPEYCNDGTPTDDFTYTLAPGNSTATVAVTVTCENTDPSITTGGSIQVDENQTGAVDVDATDPDGDTENGGGLTYAFTGGVDDNLFDLDTDTGLVTFQNAPDFEDPDDDGADNDYDISVTVTDTSGGTDTVDLVITVEDVFENQAPSLSLPEAVTVEEGTAFVVDVDASDDSDSEGAGLSYRVAAGNDARFFDIDTETGELFFQAAPDFEGAIGERGDNTLVIDVIVSDQGSLEDRQELSITVLDDQPGGGWARRLPGSGFQSNSRELLFNSAGELFAAQALDLSRIDVESGRRLWEVPLTGTWASLLSDDSIVVGGRTQVRRLSREGETIWSINLGNIPSFFSSDAVVDADDNIYVVGQFRGVVDVDPGPDVNSIESSSSSDEDAFVLKFDSSGNLVWAFDLGSTADDNALEVEIGSGSVLYVSGLFNGTVDFDPGPGTAFETSPSSDTLFIARYTLDGEAVGVLQGPPYDRHHEFLVSENNRIYLAGTFRSPFDFDLGPAVSLKSTDNSQDLFLAVLDPSGDLLQFYQVPGADPEGVSLSGDGSIFVTGDFVSTVDFDQSTNEAILTSQSLDNFLLKLSPTTTFAWVKQFGGDGFEQDAGVAIGPSGDIFATGRSGLPLTIDGSNISATIERGVFSEAPYLVKLDSSGDLVD